MPKIEPVAQTDDTGRFWGSIAISIIVSIVYGEYRDWRTRRNNKVIAEDVCFYYFVFAALILLVGVSNLSVSLTLL